MYTPLVGGKQPPSARSCPFVPPWGRFKVGADAPLRGSPTGAAPIREGRGSEKRGRSPVVHALVGAFQSSLTCLKV